MEGGKSSTTTVAELEARLKRVLAENLVDYTHKYLISDVIFMVALVFIRRYEFIPNGILDAGMFVGMLGMWVVGITVHLNTKLLSDTINVRDRFLKYPLRWKLEAAFLLLQPRAYPLMKQLLMKLVDDDAEVDLEKGKEEDEGSSLV